MPFYIKCIHLNEHCRVSIRFTLVGELLQRFRRYQKIVRMTLSPKSAASRSGIFETVDISQAGCIMAGSWAVECSCASHAVPHISRKIECRYFLFGGKNTKYRKDVVDDRNKFLRDTLTTVNARILQIK